MLKSIPWITALLSLGFFEYLLANPNAWLAVVIGVVVVLSLAIVIIGWRRYKYAGITLSFFLTMIPAVGLLFLIDNVIWQHMYSVVLGLLVVYHLKFFVDESREADVPFRNYVLPLVNLFVVSAFVFALSTFIRPPLYVSFLIFVVLLMLYPRGIERVSRHRFNSDQPMLPGFEQSRKYIELWFTFGGESCNLHEDIKKPNFVKVIFSRHFCFVKNITLVTAFQIFLVASLLPLDFFVSAATVTVVVFGVMSLIIFSELGFTKKILVRRTVAMSIVMIIVVLGSAQWT